MPLLIGGTNDGRHVSIPDDMRSFQMRCKMPKPHFYGKNATVDTVVQTELYERQRIHGESYQFEVFTIQGMTADKMIERLIANYRP